MHMKGVNFCMVSKELKKLSRRELVDIIYQMKKNEQQLHEEIESLQEQLQDKRIRLSVAGSIAEAAVSITNVFSSAQRTVPCVFCVSSAAAAVTAALARAAAGSIVQLGIRDFV